MDSRMQLTVCCFSELCFLQFSVAQVLVKQFINNFVLPTWACAAGFNNNIDLKEDKAPLEFFFQEQSYSSLHSGRSLAWDHVRGDIDNSCGAIADFCEVVADPCGADAAMAFIARLAKHHKTLLNIVKHHETHVKHCKT